MSSTIGGILEHYFQLVFKKAGIPWQSDFSVEIRETVDDALREITTDIAALKEFTTTELGIVKADIIRLQQEPGKIQYVNRTAPAPPRPLYSVRVGPWNLTIDGTRVRYGFAPDAVLHDFAAPVSFIALRATSGSPVIVTIDTTDGHRYFLDGAELGPAGWRLVRIDTGDPL